jgi:hypothetical protein
MTRAVFAATCAIAVVAAPLVYDRRPGRMDAVPRLVLWAWERPVDLRALARGAGVAFLAQTITIGADRSVVTPRRQPLQVPPAAPLVAVTRLEAPGTLAVVKPAIDEAAEAIGRTAALPRVVAIQVDFDATRSQREAYRRLLHAARRATPPRIPLSITALASWCLHDNWLDDLPIDEAVPMLFRMGPAEQPLRASIRDRMRAPICRGAIGVSLDEPFRIAARGSRVYVFNSQPWRQQSVEAAFGLTK